MQSAIGSSQLLRGDQRTRHVLAPSLQILDESPHRSERTIAPLALEHLRFKTCQGLGWNLVFNTHRLKRDSSVPVSDAEVDVLRSEAGTLQDRFGNRHLILSRPFDKYHGSWPPSGFSIVNILYFFTLVNLGMCGRRRRRRGFPRG